MKVLIDTYYEIYNFDDKNNVIVLETFYSKNKKTAKKYQKSLKAYKKVKLREVKVFHSCEDL